MIFSFTIRRKIALNDCLNHKGYKTIYCCKYALVGSKLNWRRLNLRKAVYAIEVSIKPDAYAAGSKRPYLRHVQLKLRESIHPLLAEIAGLFRLLLNKQALLDQAAYPRA
jgi:hypothetical protein